MRKMFFWFSNDTFSTIDALTKLILVITGSILIIWFCYKLTHFKKPRRYKFDFIGQAAAAQQLAGDAQATGNFRAIPSRWSDSAARNGQLHHSVDLNPVIASALAATSSGIPYDPYNTIRPLALVGDPSSAHNQAQLAQLGTDPAAASAYGYHHPTAALAALQGLATLNLNSQEASSTSLAPVEQQARVAAAAYLASTAQTVGPQIYSANVQSDCSGFRADRVGGENSLPNDSCPSYEEATRASRDGAQQQQQQVDNRPETIERERQQERDGQQEDTTQEGDQA